MNLPDTDPNDEASPEAPPEASPEAPPPTEHVEPEYRRKAWLQAALVTSISAVVITYAFRFASAGPAKMLPPIGIAYLVLAVGAWRFASARADLREQFAPRRLDLTLGALVAGVLYVLANLVPMVVLQGRPQEGWLWRLYLQLGDRSELAPPYVGVAVLALAALEEIVWRGWVMRALRVAHGARTALVATTLLYALAHIGTMLTLRDTDAGLNPLVVIAAVAGGFVWGTMALRFERLGPSIFAHALFSWAVALFPMWKRL